MFRSLVEEAGAVWADDVHELLELAKTIAVQHSKPASGARGLAIMTCSGGDSAQGADVAQELGIELPALAPGTVRRLRELLPSAATVANPLDYTAMLWGERSALAELVRTLGEDPAIGQVLVFYDQPHGLTGAPEASWRAVREAVIDGAEASPVPTLVSSTLPELLDDGAAWEFAQAGVAAAAGLRTGLRCAGARWTQPRRSGAAARDRRHGAGRATPGPRAIGWPSTRRRRCSPAHGVAVPRGRVVSDEDDAVRALGELGGHVALKLSAASIQHKTELGAVALDLREANEVRGAYRRLAALAGAHGGSVLAEWMASPGIELIVAARTDGVVPALVLGLGGIWTELLDDVAVVPLPANAARIERALGQLRGAPLLLGGRGGQRLDLGAAARLAEAVGELLVQRSLAVVECNPVLVGAARSGRGRRIDPAEWSRCMT